MAKLSDLEESQTQRVMLFGSPKSGKTQLGGELSSKFDLLFFSLENGHNVLRKLPVAQQERIDIIRIPDTKINPIAIDTMIRVISGKKINICQQHGKVNCPLCNKQNLPSDIVELDALPNSTIVVVDSLTQLAVSAINHVTRECDDDYKFEWEDYRKQGTLMDKFLSGVQQAKYNILCISHEVPVTLHNGSEKLVPVGGTTNFSRNVAKYFDHVVYAEVKNRKHSFASSTTYSNNVLTGSRSDIAIESKAEPTLLDIFLGKVVSSSDKQKVEAKNLLKGM